MGRADASGVQVIIASGRPAPAVLPYVDELALPHPIPTVCFNGACAMFLQAGETTDQQVLFSEGLDKSAAEQVLAVCEQLQLCVSYCCPMHAVGCTRNEHHESQLSLFE